MNQRHHLFVLGRRVAFHLHPAGAGPANAQGHAPHRADLGHLRQHPNPIQHLAQRDLAARRIITVGEQVHRGRQYAVGVEPGVGGRGAAQALEYSPAATSSIIERATCVTTSEFRSHVRRGEVEPPLSSLIAAITSGREARSAGISPNTNTATTEIPSVNPNTGSPLLTRTDTGNSLTGAKPISIPSVNGATMAAASPAQQRQQGAFNQQLPHQPPARDA